MASISRSFSGVLLVPEEGRHPFKVARVDWQVYGGDFQAGASKLSRSHMWHWTGPAQTHTSATHLTGECHICATSLEPCTFPKETTLTQLGIALPQCTATRIQST